MFSVRFWVLWALIYCFYLFSGVSGISVWVRREFFAFVGFIGRVSSVVFFIGTFIRICGRLSWFVIFRRTWIVGRFRFFESGFISRRIR